MKHNKILKFITGFSAGVLILNLCFINISLVSAESGETSATIEAPITEVPAPAAEPVTVVKPEAPAAVEPAAPTEPTPKNPVQSEEPIVPAETTVADPVKPLTVSQPENPTPLVSTTTEPVIFDFSQATATGTPETDNNVAGASESAGEVNPILHEILTGIVRGANIKGLTILAQWQMTNEKAEGKYLGADSSALTGAQFLPSGQFEINKPVAVCALVADAGGVADISNISATINYPEAVAKAISPTGAKSGCGGLKNQVNLEKMDFADATALVCDKLRNNNNNLLAWGSDKAENLVYSYEHLCGLDGLLVKEAAELYCAETTLAYDDPAGDYPVKISAKNNRGAAVTGENYLKYLELTTFENDFSEILYGPVKLNELKSLKGDLSWGEGTAPTVRNTGNTRARIKILQNDFGLGKTGGSWNISYQARVGTSTDFISYAPDQAAALNNLLDLGKTVNMDFNVLINNFPTVNDDSAFWGKMILSADKAEPLSCE